MQSSDSLESEQGKSSAGERWFVLAPYLALSLCMIPGEMIFRSMFYGTSQVQIIKFGNSDHRRTVGSSS
ncbi:hypothetical protein [Candidatus Ichthyocystis sparus]|uniref:hypothetical protein n=1 Tax=Candidatus Ichthyocystis sparus TaxID=1561004 RepID=UPI000B87DF0E|nr:hypothetical protein [Candidatus Ichthyocystis sparus]